jgi:hypothetical protein
MYLSLDSGAVVEPTSLAASLGKSGAQMPGAIQKVEEAMMALLKTHRV